MTILDRFLGHDAWTTRQLLLRCRELTDEQLDRPFEIGQKTLRATFDHTIAVLEGLTEFLAEGTLELPDRGDRSVEGMLARLARASKEFAALARNVEREGRADELIANPKTGNRRTKGGVIVHAVTHAMHHRAQILFLLERLGVPDAIEGDALGWEAEASGWGWDDGGSYGSPVTE